MEIETMFDGPRETDSQFGGARRIAFYGAVVIGLAVQLLIFGRGLALPLIGWFEFGGALHFIHDMAFMSLMLVTFLALAIQLYRPVRHVAGLQQVLLLLVIFLAGIAVMGIAVDGRLFEEASFLLLIYGPAVVAALLHPARGDLLRAGGAGRFASLLGGLAVIAAIPLALYAIDQAALQGSGDEHAVVSHYAGMVVFAAAIAGFALLASIRTAGWRVPLYSAAGLALVLGIGSVLYPDLASSVGPLWGGAAILWAVTFVIIGEVSARRQPEARQVTSEPVVRTG